MTVTNGMTTPPDVRRTEPTRESIMQSLVDHLYYSLGSTIQSASKHDVYTALSLVVRDLLVTRRRQTTEAHYQANPKFVYYLSAEYMLGKQLPQNLLYSGSTELIREVLAASGRSLDDLIAMDVEPGLGNGGLGRLAACFIDSLATLDMPAVGYGIRYEFGIFKQTFVDGRQVEEPDEWLFHGTPWEFPGPDNMIEVGLYGRTETYIDEQGRKRGRWIPGMRVLGEPYTTLVPGYGTQTVNILRLWRARATNEFDFQLFDAGDYVRAVEVKTYSENISKVLYPNDETPQGKELRLKQQYFFCTCSLRDIIRRFHLRNESWDVFPDKVAIQLNDTHPVIAIPELMRILLDEEGLAWARAWEITRKTFAYTCHTLLPEALERWPVSLFEHVLPRHLEIIYEINSHFLADVRAAYPGDTGRIARMSIIEEHPVRSVRMANLATVGGSAVNGVAGLHSQLLRERTLKDFGELWPEKFQNKTNGVTPRRFVKLANPRLSDLITTTIGDGWLTNLERLRELEPYADDPAFREQWRAIKRANKADLAALIQRTTGVAVSTDAIFDVIVKRLHEYKRQLLKILHIITLYHRLKDDPGMEIVPRLFLFGAKAAPGYHTAKRIIKLINNVGAVVNSDPDVNGRLRVAFPPNFGVSMAQVIYPGADISEQISTAGKEASGTGNMKFALNGALTTGTLDGANIEIRDLVGAENFFLFGLTEEEVTALKASGYNPLAAYYANAILKRAVDSIAEGHFSNGDTQIFRPVIDSLLGRDEYLVLADYQPYVEIHDVVEQVYLDHERWTRMSILNTARCGYFSSDRSIQEYCDQIWKVTPVRIP
ncbi:MAG: glycogen/starch/alpha-glucan phosphorylase [Chloroflexales bacterium]|nr:glycogen/starch/alpha-glucan phosphorylase [Chloroflexales bacterium]